MPSRSSASSEPPATLARTVDMLGRDGVRRLGDASALVAGLGGVGSHAAMGLARSGIGALTLVDFDEVTPSTLNRHAVATLADVGRNKAEVVAEKVEVVHGATTATVRRTFVDGETLDDLLAGEPDVVVDAIDSLNPKVSLLVACAEAGLQVIASMGASARRDPTLVRTGRLSETTICPLARLCRKRLRRRGVAPEAIRAVWSVEPPLPPLPPDEDEPRAERGRVRNRLPSLITLPGVFGYTLAAVALDVLLEGDRMTGGDALTDG